MEELIPLIIALCSVRVDGLTGYESAARESTYKCQTELMTCVGKKKKLGVPLEYYIPSLAQCVTERKVSK